jgi:hypothetical protein
MARLPNIKRLLTEDFREQNTWIGKLLQPLNQFMESVTTAFNKGLTVTENLDAQVASVTLTEGRVDADTPVFFKSTCRGTPKGVLVSNALDVDNKGFTGPVSVIWSYVPDEKQVKITHVYGLAASGGKYTLTLFIHTT